MKSLALKALRKQEVRPVGVGLDALRVRLKVLFMSAVSIVLMLVAQPITTQGQVITITIENEDKIPSDLDVLLDLSTKLAKIMSNFNTTLGVATKALELLDVLSSEEDRTQARFDAVHAHLDTLGLALSDQMVFTESDHRLAEMRNATNAVLRFADRCPKSTGGLTRVA